MSMYLFSAAVALLWKGLDGMWEYWRDWKVAKTAPPSAETKQIRKKMRFYAFCAVLGLGYLVFSFFARGEAAIALAIANMRLLIYGIVLLALAWLFLRGPREKRRHSTALLCLIGAGVCIAIGLGLIAFAAGGPILVLAGL